MSAMHLSVAVKGTCARCIGDRKDIMSVAMYSERSATDTKMI